MPDPELLREHGFDDVADELEAVDAAEDALDVTTSQLKHTAKIRRAADLHRLGEISTGKLLEVVLVAIHRGDTEPIRLPDPDGGPR